MDRFERRPHHEALVGLLRGAMHRNHAHVPFVFEMAHRTAQIAGHYLIKSDDEMAQTTRMSERHTRKFKARIAYGSSLSSRYIVRMA